MSTLGLSGVARLSEDVELPEPPPAVAAAVDLMAAAVMLGAAQGAHAAAIAYAQERRQFNRPLSDFQAIQWKLADSATGLGAARLLGWRAAWSGNAVDAAAARVLAGREGLKAASEALQIHGGYGYTKEFPVEGALRAIRMLHISDAARERVAHAVL